MCGEKGRVLGCADVHEKNYYCFSKRRKESAHDHTRDVNIEKIFRNKSCNYLNTLDQ